ncbi:MAG: DUF1684 domain-containing protein [Acidobacteriota bacterium]
MKNSTLTILSLIILFITGLLTGNSTEKFDLKKWEESTQKQRAEKDDYFKTSPVSPMAGLLRETIDKKDAIYTFLKGSDIKISLKEVKNPLLKVYYNGKEWISMERSGKETIRKKSAGSFKTDRFTFKYYLSDDSFILVIFDPERKMIKDFKHLLYYAPDHKFKVKAKLEKFKEIKKRTVKTSRDLEKTLIEYGKLRFTIDGKEMTLLAFKFTTDKNHPNYKYLFLPFFDKTNLIDTYEAGRFLEIIEKEGENQVIDFNECYNPLCNYATVYNCTLPPFENELDIEIKAGEKTYPH